MTTQEQIEAILEQIKSHREDLIDLMMFVCDVEEISPENYLKLLESLEKYEYTQKKYMQALESEQIKQDLFEKY